MEKAFEVMDLTARGFHRVIKTARTIADMDGQEEISERHLKEALSYRMADGRYWRK